jgi:penicillin-binding protein 2
MPRKALSGLVVFLAAAPVCLGVVSKPAADSTKTVSKRTKKSVKSMVASPTAPTATKPSTATKLTVTRPRYRVRRVYNPWDTPTYADSTWGDVVDGEDLTARRAAVQALGPFNGAVVVTDVNTGRILTVVNQKLALSGSYTPCSTIKLVATLAAINERMIDRDTTMRLSRRESMNLTVALARSNNPYFSKVGEMLGFDKVYFYAKQFGLGERAGLNIEGESAGLFPTEPPKGVPVGMMTSYGSGIGLTTLQLSALVSAIANGGTLYYLQYPRNQEEVQSFVPQVKRHLDISGAINEIKPGMMGAVDFGSGRRAGYETNETLLGKTGTCTDGRTHLGWFGSFNEFGRGRVSVVVLLTGGAPVKGPVAAGVAGRVFKNLAEEQFFAQDRSLSPAGIVSLPNCCSQ